MSLLALHDVHARYDTGGEVVRGVSLQVQPGEVVCLLGPNGAGKSSVLRAVGGYMKVSQGRIVLGASGIANRPAEKNVKDGLGFVMQGRCAIPFLTVEENLRMGLYAFRRTVNVNEALESVYQRHQLLLDFRDRPAGELSGGQQQLVELARALIADPSVLLVDEPSLGLAPRVADQVLEIIRRFADEGGAVLMVEQNVRKGLLIADRGIVLANGRVVLEGNSSDLIESHDLGKLFLGAYADGHRGVRKESEA